MEGQQLRDEIARVSSADRAAEMLKEMSLKEMSAPQLERPPALQFAVDKIEREAHALVEVAEHMVNRLRLISTEEVDLSEPSGRLDMERTGVQAADRILDLGATLEGARRRIENAIDRVGV